MKVHAGIHFASFDSLSAFKSENPGFPVIAETGRSLLIEIDTAKLDILIVDVFSNYHVLKAIEIHQL